MQNMTKEKIILLILGLLLCIQIGQATESETKIIYGQLNNANDEKNILTIKGEFNFWDYLSTAPPKIFNDSDLEHWQGEYNNHQSVLEPYRPAYINLSINQISLEKYQDILKNPNKLTDIIQGQFHIWSKGSSFEKIIKLNNEYKKTTSYTYPNGYFFTQGKDDDFNSVYLDYDKNKQEILLIFPIFYPVPTRYLMPREELVFSSNLYLHPSLKSSEVKLYISKYMENSYSYYKCPTSICSPSHPH